MRLFAILIYLMVCIGSAAASDFVYISTNNDKTYHVLDSAVRNHGFKPISMPNKVTEDGYIIHVINQVSIGDMGEYLIAGVSTSSTFRYVCVTENDTYDLFISQAKQVGRIGGPDFHLDQNIPKLFEHSIRVQTKDYLSSPAMKTTVDLCASIKEAKRVQNKKPGKTK